MCIPGKMRVDVDPKRFGRGNLRDWEITNRKSRRSVKIESLTFCRDPVTMNSVLDLFRVSLLATNQSLMLERSWFRLHSITEIRVSTGKCQLRQSAFRIDFFDADIYSNCRDVVASSPSFSPPHRPSAPESLFAG